MDEIVAYMIALIGIAIGVVLRTYAPYLKKLAEGKEELKFDKKYLWTAIAAFVIALLSAMDIIARFDYSAVESLLALFGLAVLYGTLWNSAINRYVWK